MTHQIYSQTTLTALTITQLKTIANQIGAIPDGDKRQKQVWVSAIIDHQVKFSPAKVEAMSAHIAEVMARMESVIPVTPDAPESPTVDTYIPTPPTHADDVAFASAMGLTYDDVFGEPLPPTEPQPNSLQPSTEPQQFTPNSYRGASIVVLIPLMLMSVAVMAIQLSLRLLIPLIASVVRFMAALRPVPLTARSTSPIDYFPPIPA